MRNFGHVLGEFESRKWHPSAVSNKYSQSSIVEMQHRDQQYIYYNCALCSLTLRCPGNVLANVRHFTGANVVISSVSFLIYGLCFHKALYLMLLNFNEVVVASAFFGVILKFYYHLHYFVFTHSNSTTAYFVTTIFFLFQVSCNTWPVVA